MHELAIVCSAWQPQSEDASTNLFVAVQKPTPCRLFLCMRCCKKSVALLAVQDTWHVAHVHTCILMVVAWCTAGREEPLSAHKGTSISLQRQHRAPARLTYGRSKRCTAIVQAGRSQAHWCCQEAKAQSSDRYQLDNARSVSAAQKSSLD